MGQTKLQIELTPEQRRRLESRRKRENKSLDEVVRDAIDSYVAGEPGVVGAEAQRILDDLFGSAPNFHVPPRHEGWKKRARRLSSG